MLCGTKSRVPLTWAHGEGARALFAISRSKRLWIVENDMNV